MLNAQTYKFGVTENTVFNRTMFKKNCSSKGTTNVGVLRPVYLEEVLPGDSFKVITSLLLRLSSSYIKCPLEQLKVSVHFFFVPNRLVWDKWINFIANENTDSSWVPTTVNKIPTVQVGGKVLKGTVAEAFGLPLSGDGTGTDSPTDNYSVSVLPFRAFALIWDFWYRNQNYQDAMKVAKDGGAPPSTTDSVLTNEVWGQINYTGQLPFVNKKNDYFTTVLPAQQKGDAITVPITLNGLAPVIFGEKNNKFPAGKNTPVKLSNAEDTGTLTDNSVLLVGPAANGNELTSTGPASALADGVNVYINNAYASLGNATGISSPADVTSGLTVNDLRQAFAAQRVLELDARFGTRYPEYLLGHFGVTSDNARQQRPEYLGGGDIQVAINQVVQTSVALNPTSTQLGSISGYSHSTGQVGFNSSHTEHGYIIGCLSITQDHSYSQGVNKHWTRSSRLDFYDPLLANISEQPIYNHELYQKDFINPDQLDNNIFGFKPAWEEYRFSKNMVTGELRPDYKESIKEWTFTDNLQDVPTAEEFIKETSKYVDDAISVKSVVADQFIYDLMFDQQVCRVMPPLSTPSGLGV